MPNVKTDNGLLVIVKKILNKNLTRLTQDDKIQKFECDQFKEVWHSRITKYNNVIYQLFKLSNCRNIILELFL